MRNFLLFDLFALKPGKKHANYRIIKHVYNSPCRRIYKNVYRPDMVGMEVKTVS